MIYNETTCQTCAWFRCDGIGPRGFCMDRGVGSAMPWHCDRWLRTVHDVSVFVVADVADGGELRMAFPSLDAAREALAREGLFETDRGWESDDGEWMRIEEVATCR